MPMPIIIPVGGHGLSITGHKLALIGAFIIFIYYVSVFVSLGLDMYGSRREFLLDLIPFRSWIAPMVRAWKGMK